MATFAVLMTAMIFINFGFNYEHIGVVAHSIVGLPFAGSSLFETVGTLVSTCTHNLLCKAD